jgi:isopenicillin-N N-acyltransferase-like protein
MKPLLSALMILSFALSVSAQAPAAPRPLKVVRLAGTPYDIGYQHGQFLKAEIDEVYRKWKSILEADFNIPADDFIRAFLDETKYADAIRTHTPNLWEEVRGIAGGSGQSLEDVLVFQLMDETWVRKDSLDHAAGKHHCSGIGVPALNGQPAYVAQNMDLGTWMEGSQVVMRINPQDGPEQLVLTCAGMIGLTGMNSAGIALCVNTLMDLSANTTGLPVAFVVREALARRTAAEALTFLESVPHASGQNYILGMGEAVVDLEASCHQVVRVPPDANGLVYHTNHALANKDTKVWYSTPEKDINAKPVAPNNSKIRFASLREQLKSTPTPNAEDLKNALRSKTDPANPVCRNITTGKEGFTFGSVIYTTSGRINMQVTSGPPDESAYQTFHFYMR